MPPGLFAVILTLTYRFDKCTPPKAVRMWLEHAPMAFLVIAAASFVVGLSLFAFLSSQVTKTRSPSLHYADDHGYGRLGTLRLHRNKHICWVAPTRDIYCAFVVCACAEGY